LDIHDTLGEPAGFRAEVSAETTPSHLHCRSTQTASAENEGLLGCKEKGCGQTPIKGSEQAQEDS
jgi:hypothetical protein